VKLSVGLDLIGSEYQCKIANPIKKHAASSYWL